MLKNVKKRLLYAENSEKFLLFGKFNHPHHPLNFFRTACRQIWRFIKDFWELHIILKFIKLLIYVKHSTGL